MAFDKFKRTLISALTVCVMVVIFTPITLADDEEASVLPSIYMLLFDDAVEEIEMADAARFLMQATYGPTLDEIVALTNSSYESWLDQQFALPATSHLDFGLDINFFIETVSGLNSNRSNRLSVWNRIAMEAPDQLRQRMAFALSQIFVVSDVSSDLILHHAHTQYYDLLVENAFTSYRELLEIVSLDQAMGLYLGMAGNQRASVVRNVMRPDENFAREVMQLFSIGLVELELDGTPKLDSQGNEIPTYDQAMVEEFAKVFTGWHLSFIADAVSATFNQQRETQYYRSPTMLAFSDFHDITSKTLLNVPGINPVIPPNQTAEQELEQALDILASHPNVAPFISKQLIQRFVTSNPSRAYVRRISTVFNNTDGNLQAVLRAILLDVEARQGHLTNPETFGKIKEPMLKLTGLWRGIGFIKTTPFSGNTLEPIEYLNQIPGGAPSVFNFYRPDFSPSQVFTDRRAVSPEAQLLTQSTIVNMGEAFTDFTLRTSEDEDFLIPIATDHLEELVPDNFMRPAELIDHLNIVLLAGAMPVEMRTMLLNLHSGAGGYTASNKLTVVNDILYLVTLSPYFNVQR